MNVPVDLQNNFTSNSTWSMNTSWALAGFSRSPHHIIYFWNECNLLANAIRVESRINLIVATRLSVEQLVARCQLFVYITILMLYIKLTTTKWKEWTGACFIWRVEIMASWSYCTFLTLLPWIRFLQTDKTII